MGYVVFILCGILLSGNLDVIVSDEVEIDNDGGAKDNSLVATLHNSFDFDVSVHFDIGDEKMTHMVNIKAGTSFPVKTYHGHVFHATKLGTDNKYILSSISITTGIADYFFLGSDSSALSSSSQSGSELRSRLHPAVQLLGGSPTRAMNARFRSLSSRTLDLYFDDGGEGSPQGTLGPGQDSTTNAYEGHEFFFTPHKKKHEILGRVTMVKNQVMYILQDPKYPANRALLEHTRREQAFMEEYLNRTGVHWRCYYGPEGPRAPPVLHMWSADKVGQVHKVVSSHGKWSCEGPPSRCQSPSPVPLEIEVISRRPRAFVIPDFLSPFEADAVIALARPKIKASTVGNNDGGGVRQSSTRTSSNTWIGRGASAVTETLYLRAADVLNVSEKALNTHSNSEEMQVVYYQVGQKYDAHHDWGVNGYPEARFITLLLYLSDQENPSAGGETAFPKAAGGRGIKVHPGKGSAVLFYNLLEDGNCDDLALHTATAVTQGEKWLSNFWVWDPKRK